MGVEGLSAASPQLRTERKKSTTKEECQTKARKER